MAKRRTGFFGVLWDSFVAVHGPLGTLVSLAAGILLWRLAGTSDVEVPSWVIVSMTIFGVLVVWTGCHALVSTLRQLTGFESLRVVKVLPKPPWPESILGFVIEPKAIVEQGHSVLFIHYKDRFERHIGSGAVRWCQNDGCAQVSLDELYVDDADTLLEALKASNADAMNELQILIGHVPRVGTFASKAGTKAVVVNDARNEESES